MSRFIPREKMSKKARRQLDNQRRLTWPISPVTRTFESKKQYNRKRKPHDYQMDWNHGIFFFTGNGEEVISPDAL